MTEDERDYAALLASIVEPPPHTNGLTALRRLFDRWHREVQGTGDNHQLARDVATIRRRTQ